MLVPLNEDETLILDSVTRLADGFVEGAHARDEAAEGAAALLQDVAALGLFGLMVREESGGVALGRMIASRSVSVLSAADTAVGLLSAFSTVAASIFDRHGHSDLGQVIEGGARVALTDADGTASSFGLPDAQSVLLISETSVALHTNFEKSPLTSPLGLRAAGAASVKLGQADATWDDHAALNDLRLMVAAVLHGTGRAALKRAVAYAQDRKQFGKPIAAFQAIQWKLADVATALDGAGLAIETAARSLDRSEDATAAVAAAKLGAGDAAVLAAYEAVQIHGGNGFVREYEVERAARDAQLLHSMFGSSGDCLAILAASKIDNPPDYTPHVV